MAKDRKMQARIDGDEDPEGLAVDDGRRASCVASALIVWSSVIAMVDLRFRWFACCRSHLFDRAGDRGR